MTRKPDIRYAVGAVHDDFGPVTSFAAETPDGQRWLVGWAGQQENYIIETDESDLVVSCMEADGLFVVRA
jgi:hypothetical protein